VKVYVELEQDAVVAVCAAAMTFVDTTPSLPLEHAAAIRATVATLMAAIAAGPDLTDDALQRFVEGG